MPEFPELTFEEAPHIYRLNGEQIPSVSTIMKPLSNEYYQGVNDRTLSKAAEKGTNVHNAIDNWINFGFVDIPTENRPYMDAFLQWWDVTKPEVVGTEIRMYHKIRQYAGTCDLLCYISDKLTLIDYKTSYRIVEMLYGVQLEAYKQALSSHKIEVEQKMVLHLAKDRQYKEHWFPATDPERALVFGACETLHRYTQKYRG